MIRAIYSQEPMFPAAEQHPDAVRYGPFMVAGETWWVDADTPVLQSDVVGYFHPGPTVDDVRIERERRLGLGFSYDFGDQRGVHHIGTTDADMIGWDEVTKAAQALMALGYSTQTLTIVTNSGPVVVTAAEWMQVLLAATAVRQPIWAASFALQAMSPIPADYGADHRWS